MSTSHCITEEDIAKMVAPLPEEAQEIGDLRNNITVDSSYQVLRNARSLARNNERAAQERGEVDPFDVSDWDSILKGVPDALINESKDIEIVAWYVEALLRKYGFLGIARGFSLARQLIESYGETLYPLPDEEDGIISQLSALAGLNGFGGEGALIYPIKSIKITEGSLPGPLAVWQCEQVLDADRISDADKKEAKFKQNGVTRTQFDEIMGETPTEFLLETQRNINLAIAEYERYQTVLDEYAQDDPLPTSQILDTLKNCLKTLTYIAGDRLQVHEPEQVEEFDGDQGDNKSGEKKVGSMSGPINSREDALQRLREVANYFRRIEPHSPISYSIEQAVRWSSLPLTELIKELIPDDSARTKFKHLSGITVDADKT